MDKNLVIVKERQINSGIEKVWAVLTEATTDWNGVPIETKSEWTPNSDIIFSFVWDGKEYNDKGKIIEFETEKVFSHTYWSAFSGLPDQNENYSKVQYELEKTDTGTLLKLTHSNFATETMYQHSDKNWEDTLDKIKEKCEK
jgi:uncharacterized protein YndB with AHSA1/START domain